MLSKLASTRSIGVNHYFVQEVLERPNYGRETKAVVEMAEPTQKTRMTPIKAYIEEEKLLSNPAKAKTIKLRAFKHTIIEGRLFKRGLYTPLLKCLDQVGSPPL